MEQGCKKNAPVLFQIFMQKMAFYAIMDVYFATEQQAVD